MAIEHVTNSALTVAEAAADAASVPAPAAERVPWLGFLLGDEIYAFPLGQLREVARLTGVRRVPGAPARVAGLVNLRGEIVCALDARAILGLAPRATPEGAFFVAFRGFPDPLGVIVDAITDIYAIDPGEIEPPLETWSAGQAAMFVGSARVRDGVVGLLDLHQLVEGSHRDHGVRSGLEQVQGGATS
jgi:purine-binding chemotaxis protein CheW